MLQSLGMINVYMVRYFFNNYPSLVTASGEGQHIILIDDTRLLDQG